MIGISLVQSCLFSKECAQGPVSWAIIGIEQEALSLLIVPSLFSVSTLPQNLSRLFLSPSLPVCFTFWLILSLWLLLGVSAHRHAPPSNNALRNPATYVAGLLTGLACGLCSGLGLLFQYLTPKRRLIALTFILNEEQLSWPPALRLHPNSVIPAQCSA